MPERGEVLAVALVDQGSELDGDVASGSLLLTVANPVDFDEDGGTIEINGTRYEYETVDPDSGIVTLTLPLSSAVADNDRVLVISGGKVATDYIAYVSLGDGDEVEVPIPYAERDLWPEGEYDDPVVVDLSDDLEEILTVPGRTPLRDGSYLDPNTLPLRAYEDRWVATGPGEQDVRVTYVPVPHSEHLYWNGLYQPASQWSRSSYDVVIPDATSAFKASDELVMEYLYTDDALRPVVPATATLVGSTVVGNNVSTPVALPAGTIAGDLLLVSIGTGGFGAVPVISDTRINHQQGQSNFLVGWGYADGSGSPLAITSADGENNGRCVVASYRVGGTITSVSSSSPGGGTLSPTMPAGTFSLGFVVTCFAYGGAAFSVTGWTGAVLASGANTHNEVYTCATGVSPAFSQSLVTGNWCAIAIGVADA